MTVTVLPACLGFGAFAPIAPSWVHLAAGVAAAALIAAAFVLLTASWRAPARIAAGLALASAAAAACWLMHQVWHGRLEDFRAKLRAEGSPASLADLADPEARDDPGALPFFEAALTTGPLAELNRKHHPGLQMRPWTPETARNERDCVTRFEPVLEESLEPALEQGSARWHALDLQRAAREPYSPDLPKAAIPFQAASALQLAAGWRAYVGDVQRAWRHAGAIRALAALVNRPPGLGPHGERALRKRAARTAILVMLNRPGTALPADLERRFRAGLGDRLGQRAFRLLLASRLDEARWLDEARFAPFKALNGLSLYPCQEDCAGAGMVGFEFAALRVFAGTGLLDANYLALARSMDEAAEAGTWQEASEKDLGDLRGLPAWPYLVARAQVGHHWPSSLLLEDWELRAWESLVLAVSAASASRRRTGRWPQSLAGAGVPEDPFTGAPLRYRAFGGGFEVCSAGATGESLAGMAGGYSRESLCVRSQSEPPGRAPSPPKS